MNGNLYCPTLHRPQAYLYNQEKILNDPIYSPASHRPQANGSPEEKRLNYTIYIPALQRPQANGNELEWVFMCRFKWLPEIKPSSQNRHLYGVSPKLKKNIYYKYSPYEQKK